MIWSSAYYFEVTVHQILAELCPVENFHELFVMANSSYSLHPIKLKVELLLDHGLEQHIFFLGYCTPNISKDYAPLKISVNFSFPDYFSYSLHPIKLKYVYSMMWSRAYCFKVTVY